MSSFYIIYVAIYDRISNGTVFCFEDETGSNELRNLPVNMAKDESPSYVHLHIGAIYIVVSRPMTEKLEKYKIIARVIRNEKGGKYVKRK